MEVLETEFIHSMTNLNCLGCVEPGGLKENFLCTPSSPAQGGGAFIKAEAIIRTFTVTTLLALGEIWDHSEKVPTPEGRHAQYFDDDCHINWVLL